MLHSFPHGCDLIYFLSKKVVEYFAQRLLLHENSS